MRQRVLTLIDILVSEICRIALSITLLVAVDRLTLWSGLTVVSGLTMLISRSVCIVPVAISILVSLGWVVACPIFSRFVTVALSCRLLVLHVLLL